MLLTLYPLIFGGSATIVIPNSIGQSVSNIAIEESINIAPAISIGSSNIDISSSISIPNAIGVSSSIISISNNIEFQGSTATSSSTISTKSDLSIPHAVADSRSNISLSGSFTLPSCIVSGSSHIDISVVVPIVVAIGSSVSNIETSNTLELPHAVSVGSSRTIVVWEYRRNLGITKILHEKINTIQSHIDYDFVRSEHDTLDYIKTQKGNTWLKERHTMLNFQQIPA